MQGFHGSKIMADTQSSSLGCTCEIIGLREAFMFGTRATLDLPLIVRDIYQVEMAQSTADIIAEYSGHHPISTLILALSFKLHNEYAKYTKRRPMEELDWFLSQHGVGFCHNFPEFDRFGNGWYWEIAKEIPRPLTRFIYKPRGLTANDATITVVDYYGMSMQCGRHTI